MPEAVNDTLKAIAASLLMEQVRVIFDNGTESDLLMRSLQKDENSRRILSPDAETGPLFSGSIEDGDAESGTIYVLQSKSDHPFVAAHRATIHKIGVTGGDVKARVANARKDPTYLLADVDIVATFNLANINRTAMETLLHTVFDGAWLDLELKDRFNGRVQPREWFLVPLAAIDEAVQRIHAGTIGGFRYDPGAARLTEV